MRNRIVVVLLGTLIVATTVCAGCSGENKKAATEQTTTWAPSIETSQETEVQSEVQTEPTEPNCFDQRDWLNQNNEPNYTIMRLTTQSVIVYNSKGLENDYISQGQYVYTTGTTFGDMLQITYFKGEQQFYGWVTYVKAWYEIIE